VPFLWEFHKVHHSATVLTPVTSIRVHPVYNGDLRQHHRDLHRDRERLCQLFVRRHVLSYALSAPTSSWCCSSTVTCTCSTRNCGCRCPACSDGS
jgi:hypothetical protein